MTNIEKMSDPEIQDDMGGNNQNPDKKKEIECGKVSKKCFGELVFIIVYLAVVYFAVILVVF